MVTQANSAPKRKAKNEVQRLKRKICYVFQGGGALGVYQAGAYEAFREYGYPADMIIGISIGGINAAIIAGNPPEHRVTKESTLYLNLNSHCPQSELLLSFDNL